MPIQKLDDFTYKYTSMTADKKKAVSDNETFTSKILRFWENFKWIISPASRRKNNLPTEKVKKPNLFGWTRKLLKERIFGQTRNRNAGTETLTSEDCLKNSSAKREKPDLSTTALRLELREYSDQLEPAVPVSISSLLNGRLFGKAEQITRRLDNEFNPGERDGSRLSVPVTLDCHEMNSDDISTSFTTLSHLNSPCCSSLSTSGYQTPTLCKCTHWNVCPAKHFQRSFYSRGSRLLSTDGGKANLNTEASEKLHRNCPFKTSWHQDTDSFRKKSRRRRLDSGTSHRHTRGQRSFHCYRSRCTSFPLSLKKRHVLCTCQLDYLGFNNHLCSANSTFCWKSRSYLPVCSRVTHDGNSNTTYCINTPDDKQTPPSNDSLGRHCFCHACLSKREHLWQEHRILKCSSRSPDTSTGKGLLRRDVGTSTADLIETGNIQLSKELSVDKTCNTRESLSKRDFGFEPAFNFSQPPLQQNTTLLHRTMTGSRTSGILQSSDLYKDCSRSLNTANSSRKIVADKGKFQFMPSRGEKRTEAQGIIPFKYENTGELVSFPDLHSFSCPLPVHQLEALIPDANEVVQPLPGYSTLSEGLVSKSRNVHPSTMNAAHDTVTETNSNSRRPLDRGHEKLTIEDENGLLSDDCRVRRRRLKAAAILDDRADISKLKTEGLASYGSSNQKAACGSILDLRYGSFNKSMSRCRSLKSKPELGALETLARYFASTPKREGSHVKDKCHPCASRNLLNVAEETTTSTGATKFPGLAASSKSKNPTLPGGSATTAFSDCSRFQYPSNLAHYTLRDIFPEPGFEKSFSLRDPASQTNQNTNFSLKQKIPTDNSLMAEPQNRIPWFAMNLTSCSKTSSTRYCSASLNADESESRILDNPKASVSNGLKFRRSSLSTRFSIRGDFKSDEHETSYFPNSDNDIFDTESYKYDYLPLHQLEETLPFPVI